MDSTMICGSCDKQKAELFPRKSSLLRGTTLYMCRSCIDAKMEPRWIIIMAGRRDGSESVKEFILKNRYIGRPIEASEIIK